MHVTPRALTEYEATQSTEHSHEIIKKGFALVRMPVEEGGAPLSIDGAEVECNGFWLRRLKSKDVIKTAKEKKAQPVETKKQNAKEGAR